MKKEIIGFLICTLLLSVAITPAINALTIEKNEINEVKEQTKTLSLQDTDSWEEIINDIITRFQDAETQNEKIAILKEIPIVLDKYGLLSGLSPEDLTVEEMQELIVSSYLGTIASGSLQSDKQSKVAGDSPLAVSKSVVPSNSAQLQVSGSNRLVNNNIELNTPRCPPEFPLWGICFGLIYNLQYEDDSECWWFNCYNVIVYARDYGGQRYLYHLTDGEELGTPECCYYWDGILTKHFVFFWFYYE